MDTYVRSYEINCYVLCGCMQTFQSAHTHIYIYILYTIMRNVYIIFIIKLILELFDISDII